MFYLKNGPLLTLFLFLKKNDKSNPSNYRPISLTSIVIKVLEKLVYRNVVSALEGHGLLSDHQHGF